MHRMNVFVALSLLSIAALLSSCQENDAKYAARYESEAIAAAGDAADAAASAGEGSNAAALTQMGVDHLAAEMVLTRSDVPVAQSPSPMPPPTSAERAMLAYEHEVQIRLDAERINEKVRAVRKACESAKFGACLVLRVDQSGGRYAHGSLRMRAEPKAIEPLIAAAGEGGEVGDRETRAEDLAVAVRDNDLLRDRLRKQHARLMQFQDRRDLKVEEMIALSEQISRVEAELEAAEREGATHKRRIETQLLTLEFAPSAGDEQRGSILSALRDSGQIMAGSASDMIRIVATLIPVILTLAIGIWLLRRMWRWMRGRKKKAEA